MPRLLKRKKLLRPSNAITLPIKGVRQLDDYTCGLAVAWMVAEYFGVKLSDRRLFELLNPNPARGTSQNKLITTLRDLGISAKQHYDLDWERDYPRMISQGKPVILYDHQLDHWELLYGYRRVRGKPRRTWLMVADPDEDGNFWRLKIVHSRLYKKFGIVCSKRGK